MNFLHGAFHEPDHECIIHANPFVTVGAKAPVDWFADWEATGNILDNDRLSDCCEAADLLLVEWHRHRLGLDPLPSDELTELVKLRYQQIAGWSGVYPDDGGDDPGSVTQWDCASWQAAGIVAAGRTWDAAWHIVVPEDVLEALSEAPLLLTLALDAATEDEPGQWWRPLAGAVSGYHRVVGGAPRDGLIMCRTYGFDRLVSRSRIVGVDLMRFAD